MNFLEELKFYTLLFTPLLLLLIVIGSLCFLADKKACSTKANIMGIEYSYDIFAGCMVEQDGKWQPFNDYNTVNIK